MSTTRLKPAAALLSLLIALVLFATSSAEAATACRSMPRNPNGTTITSPRPNQVITSPFTLRGMYFGSFEGVVPFRVLNASGGVIVDSFAMNECCTLSPYQKSVSFRVTRATSACVVVYQESAKDGSLTPMAMVPVTLAPMAALPNTGAGDNLPLLLGLASILLAGGLLLVRRRTA
jgi:LPXTG-motif cell wall-anchored protein